MKTTATAVALLVAAAMGIPATASAATPAPTPTPTPTTATATAASQASPASVAVTSFAATNQLGAPLSAAIPLGAGMMQAYPSGTVVSSSVGTYLVTGGILTQFTSPEGYATLGFPTSAALPGANGSTYQNFENGQIIWTSKTGAKTVHHGINSMYTALGSTWSAVGIPTTNQFASANKTAAQRFTNGTIVSSPTAGTRAVWGAISGIYASMDYEVGPMGAPTTSEFAGGASTRKTEFERGAIVWSPSTPATPLWGAIYGNYRSTGEENGPLGRPTNREHPASAGVQVANFERGAIYWSETTGSVAIYGAIFGKYSELSWELGPLGRATSNEYVGCRNGQFMNFEHGQIMWSAAYGAHAVRNGMAAEYQRRGGACGDLGLPTTDEYQIPGGVEQRFEGGTITWAYGGFTTITDQQRRQIVNFVLAQVGKPYVYGATGPNAYDCSGLVQAAYASAGINIGRTSGDQLGGGQTINLADARPGDIVGYFGGGHVSIYIGNGEIVHAGNPTTGVQRTTAYGMPQYKTVRYIN